MIKAILFGAIGTLVETSELQRLAFNQAFAEARLPWFWGPEQYKEMLQTSGGLARIQAFTDETGEKVDATRLHARKSQIFQERLVDGVPLRDGVLEVVESAKGKGVKLGFVTTTSRSNVESVLKAAGLKTSDFDFIGDAECVSRSKPHPDIYQLALSELEVAAKDCIAIEDSAVSAKSAVAAGIPTLAFPGHFHKDDQFDGLVEVVQQLSPALVGLARKAAA